MNDILLENKLFTFWNDNYEYYRVAKDIDYEPYFIKARNKLIECIPNNSQVLDVACGSAELLQEVSKKARYFGIDVSNNALLLANKCLGPDSYLIRGNVCRLPVKDSSLDIIFCLNSVEHFVRPRVVLNDMWRICKKGGKIIFISPNWGDYIFKMPPAFSKFHDLSFKIRYILNQFIYGTIRILYREAFFFPTFDCTLSLREKFAPDNDAVYAASIREIGNYFRRLGAQDIYVELRNDNDFVKPSAKNTLKNLFRFYKRVNPYYKYHGANLIIITK